MQARANEQELVLLALMLSLAKQWLSERKLVWLVTVPDLSQGLQAGYDATGAA